MSATTTARGRNGATSSALPSSTKPVLASRGKPPPPAELLWWRVSRPVISAEQGAPPSGYEGGGFEVCFVRRILYQGKECLQVHHRAGNWTGKPTVSRPHPSSSHPVARSPSGKAKVCKTFIGGSIPPRASKIFSQERDTTPSQRGKCHEQDSFGSARSQSKVQ